jgi:hypothetical protein
MLHLFVCEYAIHFSYQTHKLLKAKVFASWSLMCVSMLSSYSEIIALLLLMLPNMSFGA